MPINLSDEQSNAVELCCDFGRRLACVTGQAGTGKTTIMRAVHEEFVERFGVDNVRLAAPTGRAAKRIEEATGVPAETIHRMLKFTTPEEEDGETQARHDKFNPLPADALLIDEASMIDEELWRGLLDAMQRGAIIRFFGDINQLPPVASETSPFATAMKKFPTAILTHNYRSDDGIISVSASIIKGRIPLANPQASFFRIKIVDTMASIADICDKHDFTKLTSQIITPTQRTKYGSAAINRLIQTRYNPEVDRINIYIKQRDGEVETRAFKRGDKVIWTKNDYNLGIMNGTLGIVQAFDKEDGSILVTFDGTRDVLIPASMQAFNPTTGQHYPYDPRTSLMLGYAITTHKSQGSQFEAVLYVITQSRAATRQNLYTAVTRAKKKLVVLNVAGAMSHALYNVAKT